MGGLVSKSTQGEALGPLSKTMRGRERRLLCSISNQKPGGRPFCDGTLQCCRRGRRVQADALRDGRSGHADGRDPFTLPKATLLTPKGQDRDVSHVTTSPWQRSKPRRPTSRLPNICKTRFTLLEELKRSARSQRDFSPEIRTAGGTTLQDAQPQGCCMHGRTRRLFHGTSARTNGSRAPCSLWLLFRL